MFIRKKRIKGRTYYYLVKSVRLGERIVQKYLEYFGAVEPTKRQLELARKKHGGKKK
jgi:hypothetical protein